MSGEIPAERCFLIEKFLQCGTISDPERFYHMEFVLPDPEEAEKLLGALSHFGIPAGLSERRGRIIVYIKDSDAISDMLNLLGAHKALLEFENIRVLKGMREHVQRKVNCETANIRKTVDASVRQVEDIEFISREMGLEKLPEGLESIARMRLAMPEATLKELAEALDPPVTRSGVNHRLRRLMLIADGLREEKLSGQNGRKP